ncbi:integrase, partial [Arenimonas oryziterrae]
MGTIVPRRRKDGSTGYTAQIRLKRDGRPIHSESETFNTRALAKEWMTRREAALDLQRARGEPVGKRMTVEAMIEWYEAREQKLEPWGRTKRSDLKRLREGGFAKRFVHSLTRQDFIAYIEWRRSEGAGPATAGNDLIWLRQVFKSAAAVIGAMVPMPALEEASEYLRQARTIAKPKRRSRRTSADEEQMLLAYFEARQGDIPMAELMRFALLTARRQDEITRLQRSDLDRTKGVALLRDVKHPRIKKGNHKTFRMLDEAWAIVER